MSAVLYTAAAAMWLLTALLVLGLIHLRRTALAEAEMTRWAQETMLMVTDRSALVHTYTISDLYDRAGTEHIWIDPVAVSIWRAGPDLTGCAAHDHREHRA